jgi:rSAM/selenodomain-associated transferase 2
VPPVVTVVIPVLSDTDAAARLLAQLAPDPRVDVVVVDAGGDTGVERLAAARPGTRLHRSTPGRARQMNLGARDAAGEWLFFVHADSVLPAGWLPAIAALGPEIAGGWFRFALDDAAWQARALERLVAWRVQLFRLPYGDQGFFVRLGVFRALGGFRDWPLLEDVEFVRRLVRHGPTAELPLPLQTSARRWRRDGWLRRSARNLTTLLLYFAGVPPDRLNRWYQRRR